MFQERDCTLVEINPLAETKDGEGSGEVACLHIVVTIATLMNY